jgi:hypothetical protein
LQKNGEKNETGILKLGAFSLHKVLRLAKQLNKQKGGKIQTCYAVVTDDLATPHRPRQLCRTESLHPPGYHVMIAVLRTKIKQMSPIF